ncbi:MAG: hypothetical protein JWO76_1960 [Nocardioides sp.]|nr:hypothetical protein [Nocardioides sp.]
MNQLQHVQVPATPAPCRGFVTELVVRCGRGDETALGDLLDLFYAPVLALVERHGGSRPTDDVVTEAFVHLWRRAPSFRPGRCGVDWVMEQLTTRVLPPQRTMAAS